MSRRRTFRDIGATVLALACIAAVGCAGGCAGGEGGSAPETDSGASADGEGGEGDSAPDTLDGVEGMDGEAADTQAADGASEEDTSGEGGPSSWGGPCMMAERVGGFELKHLQVGPGSDVWYSSFAGEVKNGVIPNTVLELVETVGDCQFLKRINPFCSPVCTAGQTCALDGRCIPYPANQSVGHVAVSGVHDEISLEPTTAKNYFDSDLPFPVFEPGAEIELSASGADVEAFALQGRGVEPLVVDDIAWVMAPDTPLTIHWTPSRGQARVLFSFNVDQHGLSPVSLVCDVADVGVLTVDGSLISKLLLFGVSGFASGTASRRTVDHADLSVGCIDFVVGHDVFGLLSVEGHEPCFSDLECSEGLVCDVSINTCVPQ